MTETSYTQPAEGLERPIGNYVLIRETGWGAMSTVYQAVDTRIGRTVALKVLSILETLPEEERKTMIRRLDREARAIARLSHPNVVTIYDIGEQDGAHYIAMEYLQGRTLRERLDQGPLPLSEASQILDQVADGLDAVHGRGVVHRDLKPANVMLLPEGRVKLMDFGSAHLSEDANITQLGGIVGSPAYLAPERLRGGPGTPSSDLWAVGVLLYEMLAGRPPFAGTSIPSVLHQVAQEEPSPLTGVPPKVQKVVARALEKDPAKRFHSAREMAEALHQAQPAATPSWMRVWQWGSLPLALLIGALIASHQLSQTPKAVSTEPVNRSAGAGAPSKPPSLPMVSVNTVPHPTGSVMLSTPPHAVPSPLSPKHHAHHHHHRHHPQAQPAEAAPAPARIQEAEAPPRHHHHHHRHAAPGAAVMAAAPPTHVKQQPHEQHKPASTQQQTKTPAPAGKPAPPTTLVGGSRESNPAPPTPVHPPTAPPNHPTEIISPNRAETPTNKPETSLRSQNAVMQRLAPPEPAPTLQQLWLALERFIWNAGPSYLPLS